MFYGRLTVSLLARTGKSATSALFTSFSDLTAQFTQLFSTRSRRSAEEDLSRTVRIIRNHYARVIFVSSLIKQVGNVKTILSAGHPTAREALERMNTDTSVGTSGSSSRGVQYRNEDLRLVAHHHRHIHVVAKPCKSGSSSSSSSRSSSVFETTIKITMPVRYRRRLRPLTSHENSMLYRRARKYCMDIRDRLQKSMHVSMECQAPLMR